MYQGPLQFILIVAMLLVGSPAFEMPATGYTVDSGLVLMAQSVAPVSVNVQPPKAIEIVLFSAGATGKVLTTTDRDGQGNIDGAALANLGRLDVIEETCGPRTRVLLVASNGKATDAAQCNRQSIGSFASGQDKTLKAELFRPLPRAATIPDPPASQPGVAAQRGAASPAPAQPGRTAATAGQPCPPGASMVGAKLDLSPDADSFEKAPLLVPCVYRGVADTDKDRWLYYKFQVAKGQTLKVTTRLRDSELPPIRYSDDSRLFVRLHDANGGQIGKTCSIQQGSATCVQEAKAEESGVVFVSMLWTVRDAAFLISIQ
jgi:hypothetical protein